MKKVELLKLTPEYKEASRGKKAAMVSALKYGPDFHKKIGSKGGVGGTEETRLKKGFGSMDKERLIEVGRKGGEKSRKDNVNIAGTGLGYERLESDTR